MKATSFKTVPVKVVGQSYEHRSEAVSIEKTMNLIPQSEQAGITEVSLTTWPGCKVFATLSGNNRGMTVFNDELYKVNDNRLHKIDSAGVVTNLGTIAGTNRCIFANDGTNLIITTGSTGYQLTGTTLITITDTDFQNGNSVTYINQQMIYDGNGGKFQVSNVGDPDSFLSNNFATAESSPDDTIRVFAFRERIYVFGEKSIETWWNSGSGNPPVARVQNGTMNIGLGAIHSVVATDDFMYFLGDDRRAYRVSGSQPQNITSIAVSHQFDLMTTSDAIGTVVRIEGQSFYMLSFPLGDKTFVFGEDSKAWFNLSTGVSEGRYKGEDYVEVYGKRLIADKASGGVSELDLTLFTDNGETKVQERTFGPLNGIAFNEPGSRFLISWVDLIMEMGVGIPTGQGSDPKVLISASIDGGESFTNEDEIAIGRTGAGRSVARWHFTRSAYEFFIKVRVTDPVFISIYGASVGVKASGI